MPLGLYIAICYLLFANKYCNPRACAPRVNNRGQNRRENQQNELEQMRKRLYRVPKLAAHEHYRTEYNYVKMASVAAFETFSGH